MRRIVGLLLTLLLLLCAGAALGETARVATPGGKLNIRKTAEDKGKLVTSVPNHALVEAEPAEEEGWLRVTYKGKTGYARDSFFLLPSRLPGKTVCSDGGTVMLRAEPADSAVCVGIASALEPLEVLSVQEGWAQVRHGEITGWTKVEQFSWQREEPKGDPEWVELRGVAVMDCYLSDTGDRQVELRAGTEVRVALSGREQCWVAVNGCWGAVPLSAVSLIPPEEAEDALTGIGIGDAQLRAEETLRRKHKAFAKTEMYAVTGTAEAVSGIQGPLYVCAFCDENDQMLYLALVRAQDGKVLFTQDCAAFAVPPAPQKEFLPEGEIRLTFSTTELRVGEVLDIEVAAWTDHACAWFLTRSGMMAARCESVPHFRASWRPKEAGDYVLQVTVSDEAGRVERVSTSFTVTEADPGAARETLFSQKDGWWLDKKYRKSTLDQSGCAIFTLSHALERLGITGPETAPEALARRFALCLTPDGTNNERLLREAGEFFGFETARDLITNGKKIAEHLRGGDLFSFSIVRGHIALIDGISEDGSMVHIVDSAPGATMERKTDVSLYRQTRSGGFRAVLSLDELPGARWYFGTGDYGALEYWMPLSYAAQRGVRLIAPAAQQGE